MTGLYKTFRFQFSDTSLQVLTSELVKWGSTTNEKPGQDENDNTNKRYSSKDLIRNKYIIDLTRSLDLCSVNMVLHHYQ